MAELMSDGIPIQRSWPMWIFIGVTLGFLYIPLFPILIASIRGGEPGQLTFASYSELLRTPLIAKALRTTIVAALVVGAVTPLLGLLGAWSIRELGRPRFI